MDDILKYLFISSVCGLNRKATTWQSWQSGNPAIHSNPQNLCKLVLPGIS